MKRYKLISIEPLTTTSLLLTVQARRTKDQMAFYPGQYAALGFKRTGRPSPMRCFSIIHVPGKSDLVQFGVRVEGNFTQTLSGLQPGASVFLEGPFGNFIIDQQYDKNIVMMAGGIGITPFMSMIRAATEYQLAKPMVLLYSCRSQHDIPFYKELLDLERRNPRFRTAFFITDGKIDATKPGHFVSGRISEESLARLTHQQFNHFTYFICGPKRFMRDMESHLVANNTDPAKIVTEDFTASSHQTAASAPAFSIPRWTYGLTAAGLVLGTAFIMGLDLVRAVPRLNYSQLVKSATSSAQAAPSQSTDPAGNAAGPARSDSAVQPNDGSGSSAVPSPPTPQAQQSPSYYQPPMTSVS